MCIIARTVAVDHLEVLAVLRREVLLEDVHADHRVALVAQIFPHVDKIDQAAGRLDNSPMQLMIEFKPGLHDLQIDRAIVDQVHHDLFHTTSPGDAVDEVQVAGCPAADGKSLLVQNFGLPTDGRVIEPVGVGKMRAVEVLQSVDSGKRQVAGLKILAGLELGILVPLSEVALDAAVGELTQLGTAVDRLDVSKVVAHHTEQLLHVLQTEMAHDREVDFGRAFVLDRNAVVSLSVGRTKYPFS